jgi:hypothetical protein
MLAKEIIKFRKRKEEIDLTVEKGVVAEDVVCCILMLVDALIKGLSVSNKNNKNINVDELFEDLKNCYKKSTIK